ncbi:MAG: hypothetical protein EXS03_00690 [Phycisphaerales bacterium]|nr:hypothetical protein [Phycisphaerales bacterium]
MMTTLLLALSLTQAAPTPAAALESMRAIVASDPARCAIRKIGSSWSGAPIEVLVISENAATADERPAVLVVAGIDAERPSSVAVAVEAARKLLATPEELKGRTYYIVPCANPDALLDTAKRAPANSARNGRAVDEDRDRRADEDPPRDIDGDGRILVMRRISPGADDPPTHLPDPADPRLMRSPDAAKDLRATHSMSIEGLDSDGDGLVAEDAIGGVDFDRNFPHRWKEFDPSAGAYPLSEPETMALARFVIDHPRIVAAVVASRWDNMVVMPDSKAKDITGKSPMTLHGDDQPLWEELGRIWKERSGQTRAQEWDPSGSLALWLYVHRGIPTCATQLWGRPDPSPLPPPPVPAAPESAPPVPAPPAPPKAADEESLQWLLVSDRDQGGRGFVPWAPFDHPTLGKVEIGGFAPGFRTDPPASEIDRLAKALAGIASTLANRRPRCEFANVSARQVTPGLIEIECEVVNTGWLPTATAMGRMNKTPPPIVVRISAPKECLESGRRVTIIDGLAGAGGRQRFKWLVRAQPGERLVIESRWKPQGTTRVSIIDGAVQPTMEVVP